jgi:acyl-CoA thioesterase II
LKKVTEQELHMPIGIDVRFCRPRNPVDPKAEWPARQFIWVKTNHTLPDNPLVHQSVVAYSSDRFLVPTVFYPYELIGFDRRIKIQTSLDYSIWFHDGFALDPIDAINSQATIPRTSTMPPIVDQQLARADDWLLYDIDCPVQTNNRAWVLCRIWTRQGHLIGTCTQESLIRAH